MDVSVVGNVYILSHGISRTNIQGLLMAFVVAAVHSAYQQDERTMAGRIIKAMENPSVDILAHLSGWLIGEREPYRVNMTTLLEATERTGTAEISATQAD